MKQGDLVAGRYRLLRPVGEGASGVVWAARHELLGRDFALKIAANSERAGHRARDLFLREVQIVGKLRHPNIVDIADAGDAGEAGLYLAMELLEGESLAQRIAREPLAADEAIAIVCEVARGLAAAHAAGVVHRDVKPENIFLARGTTGGVIPKLLDFGVSSARDVGGEREAAVYGTPAYMSPEQALGEGDIDARTDVWALGVVLYEALTGAHPFRAESYPALLPRIIEEPYPPLPEEIPSEVRAVVAGCLAKDRADRYADGGAALAAMEPIVHDLPARSGFFVGAGRGMTSAPAIQVTTAPAPRSPRRALVTAIFVVLLTIAVLVALPFARRDPRSSSSASAASTAREASAASTTAAPVTTATPNAATADPGPAPPVSVTMTAPPIPSASAKARAQPSAAPAAKAGRGAPPAGKAPVTRIDSAGF